MSEREYVPTEDVFFGRVLGSLFWMDGKVQLDELLRWVKLIEEDIAASGVPRRAVSVVFGPMVHPVKRPIGWTAMLPQPVESVRDDT